MIKIKITLPIGFDKKDIAERSSEILKRKIDENTDFHILALNIDTSIKGEPKYKATVGISFDDVTEAHLCLRKKYVEKVEVHNLEIPKANMSTRPIVIGSGPAGLFASLILAESGARPIVLERGFDADKRVEAVNTFFKTGILCENSNVQFGEGGAGTFSDGKLKPGKPDEYKNKVIEEFIEAGAPEEIAYIGNPHIGTDILCRVVKNIRQKLISLGADVIFEAKVTDILVKDGKICGVEYEKDSEYIKLYSEKVFLATGHSAHDVFEILRRHNVPMKQKGFGIGVRIEHPQKHIDKIIYGREKGELPSASYHLVTHLKDGRSVYSFCMCPGGTVVAAASSQGRLVTNGMSVFARDGENANAAFLVSVTPEDFESDDALSGLVLQEKLERRAFSLTNSFTAPVLRMEDFVYERRTLSFGDVKPTYPVSTVFANADEFLPAFIENALRASISDFEAWMPGFYYPDAILTGVETRTTSPVLVCRNEKRECETISGLYPCGEGAGYAGGIVSSAVDGIKSALASLE